LLGIGQGTQVAVGVAEGRLVGVRVGVRARGVGVHAREQPAHCGS